MKRSSLRNRFQGNDDEGQSAKSDVVCRGPSFGGEMFMKEQRVFKWRKIFWMRGRPNDM
jgi:hypothetical protein